ncbi:hypothetical protein MRX96_026494 [Rhipicephalus microplus]
MKAILFAALLALVLGAGYGYPNLGFKPGSFGIGGPAFSLAARNFGFGAAPGFGNFGYGGPGFNFGSGYRGLGFGGPAIKPSFGFGSGFDQRFASGFGKGGANFGYGPY